jgi:hypothetical protein
VSISRPGLFSGLVGWPILSECNCLITTVMLQECIVSHSIVTDGQLNGSTAPVSVQSATVGHIRPFQLACCGWLSIGSRGDILLGSGLRLVLLALCPTAYASLSVCAGFASKATYCSITTAGTSNRCVPDVDSRNRVHKHQAYSQHYLNYTFVLHPATEEQIFEIAPSFLPHNEIYLAFEAFLTGELLETGARKGPQENS